MAPLSGACSVVDSNPFARRSIPIEATFLRFQCDEVDPLVMILMLQHFMAGNELLDPFSRRLDDGQQAHRLMIRHVAVHHGLPGKSEPEIAPRAGHDADPPHHVVVNLTPAPIHLVVHC